MRETHLDRQVQVDSWTSARAVLVCQGILQLAARCSTADVKPDLAMDIHDNTAEDGG